MKLKLLILCFISTTILIAQKPQTPKEPFNYTIEEVEYDNGDKSLHYGATLTVPKNKKNFPTVIIISGSGSQDRNGTMLGHQPYWVLADYLSNHGIAVLRVDDRGTGKSTIGPNRSELTSASFSYDVETSLNYLQQRADINKNNIGLIGHSEGGIIAPMLAARRPDISFIVLWGAPIIGGIATNISQNIHALKQAKIDSAAAIAFGGLHQQVLSEFTAPDTALLHQKIREIYKSWMQQQDSATLKALYASEKFIIGQSINVMYDGLYNLKWMRYFINYNPSDDLKKVKCRVLAIIGEKDTQVDAESNLTLTEKVLRENGNKKILIKKMPSLNHLFQTATTGDFSEYAKIEETISPSAMKTIGDWINKK